jgi:hypothetical protein
MAVRVGIGDGATAVFTTDVGRVVGGVLDMVIRQLSMTRPVSRMVVTRTMRFIMVLSFRRLWIFRVILPEVDFKRSPKSPDFGFCDIQSISNVWRRWTPVRLSSND